MSKKKTTGRNEGKKTVVDEQNRVQVIVELTKPKTEALSAMSLAENLSQQGFELDTEYGTVPMTPNKEIGASLESEGKDLVAIRGKVDKNKIKELEDQPNVIKVWEDTAGIQPFDDKDSNFVEMTPVATGPCPIPPCDCSPGTPKGTINDVIEYLGVDAIHGDGIKGQNIVVAIHDGGITAQTRVPRIGQESLFQM